MTRRIRAKRTTSRAVLVAHAFVQGGTVSDSERPLSIGGAETIDAAVFNDFTYVALGHLHRPQKIGSDRIQYSGSMLKYSLSETGHGKSVTIVDIDADGEIKVDRVGLPLLHDLRRLEGTLQELLDAGPQGPADDYLAFWLQDKGPVHEAMARLRQIYPNALHIAQEVFYPEGGLKLPDHERRKQSPRELFGDFFEQVQGEALTDPESQVLDEVISTLDNQEKSA
jgi:exonuclease SbcD